MLENRLVDDSEAKRTAFLHSLGRFPRYRLNKITGHLSSFPVANILGVTSLVFTLSPPCLVSEGSSVKVRNSLPSSLRCKMKSLLGSCFHSPTFCKRSSSTPYFFSCFVFALVFYIFLVDYLERRRHCYRTFSATFSQ